MVLLTGKTHLLMAIGFLKQIYREQKNGKSVKSYEIYLKRKEFRAAQKLQKERNEVKEKLLNKDLKHIADSPVIFKIKENNMKLDLKEISKTIINLDNATIKDAINSMNNSSLKIVLVINKNKKLAGTIVDGDIRRGLLGGLDIGSSIKSIVQYNPKVVKDGVSFFEAAEIMKVNYFNHLPIVDKNYKLQGLYVLEFMKKTHGSKKPSNNNGWRYGQKTFTSH